MFNVKSDMFSQTLTAPLWADLYMVSVMIIILEKDTSDGILYFSYCQQILWKDQNRQFCVNPTHIIVIILSRAPIRINQPLEIVPNI